MTICYTVGKKVYIHTHIVYRIQNKDGITSDYLVSSQITVTLDLLFLFSSQSHINIVVV